MEMEPMTPTSIQQEGIIIKGKDTRLGIVTKMDQYPYQNLLMLYIISNGNKFGIGTAFQINSHYAITAAHNLWDKQAQKPMKKVRIFPSAAGNLNLTKPQPHQVEVQEYRFPQEYLKKIKEARKKGINFRSVINHWDYALIKLSKGIERKEYLTICTEFQMYKDYNFEVAGFPGQVSSGSKGVLLVQPKRGHGQIQQIYQGIIYHKIDTSPGQSGSPLMVLLHNKGYYVIGMHFFWIQTKQFRMNYAIEFNPSRVQQIHKWMKEMSQPNFNFYSFDMKSFRVYGIQEIIFNQNKEANLKKTRKFCFDFNWNRDKPQKIHFDIQGGRVQKKTAFSQSNYQYMTSYETLLKGQRTVIMGQAIHLQLNGSVWFGIINKLTKKYLQLGQISATDCHSHGIVGAQLLQNQGYIGYNYKTDFKFNNSISQDITIDYDGKSTICILKGETILIQYNPKEDLFKEDTYLCVILKEKGDCLQVN